MIEYACEYFKTHGDGMSGHAPLDLADRLNAQAKEGWRLKQMAYAGPHWYMLVFEREVHAP